MSSKPQAAPKPKAKPGKGQKLKNGKSLVLPAGIKIETKEQHVKAKKKQIAKMLVGKEIKQEWSGLPFSKADLVEDVINVVLHSQIAAIRFLIDHPIYLYQPDDATESFIPPAMLAGYFTLGCLEIARQKNAVNTAGLQVPATFASKEFLIPQSLAYYIVSILGSRMPPLWRTKLQYTTDYALTTSAIIPGVTLNDMSILQDRIGGTNPIFGNTLSLFPIQRSGGSSTGCLLVNPNIPNVTTLLCGPTSLANSDYVSAITRVLSNSDQPMVPIEVLFNVDAPDHSYICYPVGTSSATIGWNGATVVGSNTPYFDRDIAPVLSPLEYYTSTTDARNLFPNMFGICAPMVTTPFMNNYYDQNDAIVIPESMVAHHLMLFHSIGANADKADFTRLKPFKKFFRVKGLWLPSEFCKILFRHVNTYEFSRRALFILNKYFSARVGFNQITTDVIGVFTLWLQGAIQARMMRTAWNFNALIGARTWCTVANFIAPMSLSDTTMHPAIAALFAELDISSYNGYLAVPYVDFNYGGINCSTATQFNKFSGFLWNSATPNQTYAGGQVTGSTAFPIMPLQNITTYNTLIPSGNPGLSSGVIQFGQQVGLTAAIYTNYTSNPAIGAQTSQMLFPWFTYAPQLESAQALIFSISQINHSAVKVQRDKRYLGSPHAFDVALRVPTDTNQPEYAVFMALPCIAGVPQQVAPISIAVYKTYQIVKVSCAQPKSNAAAAHMIAYSPFDIVYANVTPPQSFPAICAYAPGTMIENQITDAFVAETLDVDGSFVKQVVADQLKYHGGPGALIRRANAGLPKNCLLKAMLNVADRAAGLIAHPATPLLAESACVAVDTVASVAGLSIPGGVVTCKAVRKVVATAGSAANWMLDRRHKDRDKTPAGYDKI